MNQFRATPSPSEGMSNAEEIRKFVQDNRIRNGCPARNFALPSALYSPILADLAHTLTDSELNKIDPTPQVLDLAYRLIRDLIRSYDRELDREQQLRETLDGTFLDCNGGFFQQHSGADGPRAKPEYFWPLALIYELKNIKGMRGDPTLQAVSDYLKLLVDPKWVDFTRKSNCPCLSLGISDTQIEIACLVFAREVHFDSLFVDNVRDGFDLHSRVLRLARVLTTVLRTLNLLKSFYRKLQDAPLLDNSQRFFPQPVPLDSAFPVPKFQFLQRLFPKLDDSENPAPGVFIGIMEESAEDGSYTEGDRVVVKFSSRYNAHAQELLARMNLAPSVYYYQRLRGADFIMTIMEYVEGTMVSKWEDELPREFYTKLESAVALLHEAGYVFGDLRVQNVLVVHGTDPMILDFDWVALAGQGRYPASIDPRSVSHGWAPGVERNGLMQKEHDLHMLQTFETLCCQA